MPLREVDEAPTMGLVAFMIAAIVLCGVGLKREGGDGSKRDPKVVVDESLVRSLSRAQVWVWTCGGCSSNSARGEE